MSNYQECAECGARMYPLSTMMQHAHNCTQSPTITIPRTRHTQNERLRELYFIRRRAEQAWEITGEDDAVLYGVMVDANTAFHTFAATLEETT